MKKKIPITLFMACLLTALSVISAFAVGTTDVVFSLGTVNVAPGEIVEVPLIIQSSVDITTLGLSGLSYDSNALTFLGFTNYSTLSQSSIISTNGFDDTKKTITLGYSPARLISGEICSLKFRADASASGDYAVTFTSPVVKNVSTDVSASVTAGKIHVETAQQKYIITYDANGGSGAPSAQTKIQGVALTLSSTIPTKTDYIFLGWSTSNTATSVNYSSGAQYTADSEATLYAVWKKNGVSVTSVSLNRTSAEMSVGDSLLLKATVSPADATNKNVTWSSSNSSVVTVSNNGEVKAISEGTATITVATTEGSKTATCVVVVKKIDVNAPQIVVETKTAGLGKTVLVNISIINNPGIIAMKIDTLYDADSLELLEAVGVDYSGISFGPLTNNPFTSTWDDALNPNNTDDGVFIQLKFKVKDDAKDGFSPISVTYDPDNVFDSEFEDVTFVTKSGGVQIVKYMPGDVDRSGTVNLKDYALLKQYINGWNVDIEISVADVNGDGSKNLKDLALLRQAINGWDVILK